MKRTLGLLLFSLVLTQGVTGCRFSEDRAIYKSTYLQPTSVYAVYKPSNETAWTYDIPPQHQLVVEFDAPDGNVFGASKNYANKLTWALYPIDASRDFLLRERFWASAIDSGTMDLSGSPIILGSTVGKPVDPSTIPTDRSIEDIEKDLPDPDALPEPDAAEDAE